ncbi:MAG: hypothetical protein AAFY54_01920 [Cyanobacteria bacterium J06648_10]
MLKFFAKLVGWLFLVIIGFGIAVMGVGMLTGMVVGVMAMIVTYIIPAAIGAFIVGSVLYVLWGILFGDD